MCRISLKCIAPNRSENDLKKATISDFFKNYVLKFDMDFLQGITGNDLIFASDNNR